MELDPLFLSRLQFTWVIVWHILLPAFTVGLATYIALLEGIHYATGKAVYLRISNFWIRIFAISFVMGVVSGIVLPFQFGTNWSRFADATANVLSPLFAYEGLTAFLLESAFLGVLLFGRNLVPRWAYFSSALIIAAGTLFSSFWILAANSWMQTPQGFEQVDGLFYPADWWQIVFTPSLPYRLAHTVIGFYITTAFAVIGVAAFYLLRNRYVVEARSMLSMTFWLLAVLVPAQIYIGDLHGLNTLEHQPVKVAAIEANWETTARMPLILFAWPDAEAETNYYAVEIPALGSVILRGDPEGIVPGLTDWPASERPPVWPVFVAFRVMVGIGLLFLAVIAASLYLRARGRLFDTHWFLKTCIVTAPLGFIAVLAGWTVTEVGRQPWTVYEVMRTADSVTPVLSASDVIVSLIGYMIAYLVIFPAGIYFMWRAVKAGPVDVETPHVHEESFVERVIQYGGKRSGDRS